MFKGGAGSPFRAPTALLRAPDGHTGRAQSIISHAHVAGNYDLKFDFTWGTRKEHTTKRVDTDELQGALKIVNFGAVAQEKKIEKDKIYCLGLDICTRSGVSGDNRFYIEIGEGFLNSSNNYQTFDDKTIRFLPE